MAKNEGATTMFTFWKLLVGVILLAAVCAIIFGVISALAGIVWFFIKVIVVLALVYFVVRFALRKK